jgi:hypothetical protein
MFVAEDGQELAVAERIIVPVSFTRAIVGNSVGTSTPLRGGR